MQQNQKRVNLRGQQHLRTPDLDNNIGEDEIAANTVPKSMPSLRKSISFSSYNAGNGFMVPGKIKQS